MIAVVKKLSICDCGFPLFKETVTIGDAYSIVHDISISEFDFTCGGCKKSWPVICVRVRRDKEPAGWLPSEAFNFK